MDFGLTCEDIAQSAIAIAEKSGCKHPFSGNKARRGWFEGFKAQHPKLTLRTPQQFSYHWALCSDQDFFSKLGAIYGRLNLVAKPMQVFIADKRGVGVVHKTGKVVAKLGQDLCSSSHSHLRTVNIVFGTAPSLMCSETFFPWVDHLGGGGEYKSRRRHTSGWCYLSLEVST